MENISRRLEKSVTSAAAPQMPKRSSRWTILLVGDNGKIISIPWIKPLGAVFVFFFLAAVAASGLLYFFFQKEIQAHAELQDRFDRVQAAAVKHQNEKEVLLARAVIAETRIAASVPPEKTGDEEAVPDTPNGEADRSKTPEKAVAASLPPVEKKAGNAVGESLPIGVDEPSLSYDPVAKRILVQIKIANQGSESQPVSGYVFVRLNPEPGDPSQTLVIPKINPGPQMSSKYNLGQYFTIARFVTMGFKAPYSGNPGIFQSISVYVFSTSGKMLLQKDLPVQVPVS